MRSVRAGPAAIRHELEAGVGQVLVLDAADATRRQHPRSPLTPFRIGLQPRNQLPEIIGRKRLFRGSGAGAARRRTSAQQAARRTTCGRRGRCAACSHQAEFRARSPPTPIVPDGPVAFIDADSLAERGARAARARRARRPPAARPTRGARGRARRPAARAGSPEAGQFAPRREKRASRAPPPRQRRLPAVVFKPQVRCSDVRPSLLGFGVVVRRERLRRLPVARPRPPGRYRQSAAVPSHRPGH